MKRYIVIDETSTWYANGWVAKEICAFWLGMKSWICPVYSAVGMCAPTARRWGLQGAAVHNTVNMFCRSDRRGNHVGKT